MPFKVRRCVVLLAMFAPLTLVRGQTAGAPAPLNQGAGAVLSGRVTEAGDTVGVPGAEIEVVDAGVRHWADKWGRFNFPGVPAGNYDVRVRILGYRPWTERMTFEDGRAYDRTVVLQRLPHALTEVRIDGRMLKVPARYEDVYRRAARGWGTFITREDIERLNPVDVKSLLYTIPGVLVSDHGLQFARCMDNISGMSVEDLLAMLKRGGLPQPGKVQVYIDGARMTRTGADYETALRLVVPTAIQAIEVYRGVSQIPVEFLDDACAVIAIWTKSY